MTKNVLKNILKQKRKKYFYYYLKVKNNIFLFLFLFISSSLSLNPEERQDLARKFKYYYKSVRPSEEFNMVKTINGTFFRLLTQLELIDTREFENFPNYLGLEFSLFIHFRDDRLQLRDLHELPISLSDELFTPWQPRIQLLPLLTTKTINYQKSTYLSPNNGLITFIYRFSGQLYCDSQTWKEPFEKYSCHFWFETNPDERLQLTIIRDLRSFDQINYIKNEYEQWPWLLLRFNFCSKKWQKVLICFYLPSLMLFVSALLAQWKRRKIQVFVLIGVIISLILLQNIYSKSISSPFSLKFNLMDLWLACIFVHLICLLSIDLAFPARRIIIFKQKIMKKRNNNIESSELNDELIMACGKKRQRKKEIISSYFQNTKENNNNKYSSPLFSTLTRKIGIQQIPSTINRQFRATFFPSSQNSLLHHYVSSPKLSSSNNQQKQFLTSKKLLPTCIYSTPSSPYCSSKANITSNNQMARTSSVPPFKDISSSFSNIDNIWPEGEEDPKDEKRQKAITQLLNEMEFLRNVDNDNNNKEGSIDKNKFIINSSNQQNKSLINKQPQQIPSSTCISSNIPKTLPLQQKFNLTNYPLNSNKQYKIGKTEIFSGDEEEEEEEIGRIEGDGLGLPKQKRIPFLVIFTSFCIFLSVYLILILMVIFDWL